MVMSRIHVLGTHWVAFSIIQDIIFSLVATLQFSCTADDLQSGKVQFIRCFPVG